MLDKMSSIPNDKLLHSFYGVLVYIVCSLINPVFGLVAVVFVAIAKEVYDEVRYSGFDWLDILATVAIPVVLYIKEVYSIS